MSPRPAFDALQISALDNTATLLKSVRISDEVVVGGQTDVLRIKALDDTPFGHKISIRDIHSSLRAVRKYSLRKYLIVPLLMHAASAIEGIPDLTEVWASVISWASFHA